MHFFSSPPPPPPPPPPPAPAPFLASLLEDPQAAVASLLESVVASDLSVMPLPTFLIKFMLKHVVGLLFGAQANCARKMAEAAATGAPNPHNAAIAADDFYSGFVNPKVNARIAKLKEEAGR